MFAFKDRSLRWASFTGDVWLPASSRPEMTSFFPPFSSRSRCFPKSSVPSSAMRPLPAPPLDPPSPPTPPEPPDPPDPQIRPSSGEAHAQLLFLQLLFVSQRVHRESEPPFLSSSRSVPSGRKSVPPVIALPPPRRSSRHHHRLLLPPCSSNETLGFHCLGMWLGCLLGQNWRTLLLCRKRRAYLMGHMIPTLSPIGSPYRSRFISFNRSRLKPSPLIKTRFLYSSKSSRSACSFAVLVTIPLPLLFPQVSSCSSLSDSSTVGSYWMDVENVALAWWNSGLVIALSMIVDSRGSTFVLSNGTFIALVRPFTAICSPITAICSPLTAICSPFTAICSLYFELTLLGVALLQIGQRFLSSFTVPVMLVRRGFNSPHLSFTELIILPNTSLVFSVIVIGRLVIKHVLLDAEARIVVQDGSRSAFVDGLTSEALFPPPCGFSKDYRVEDVCSSALVAEALALRIIVEQLAEHPARFTTDSIEVLSDSQGLISSIKTKASSKELKAILHDITYVSDSLKSLSIHFVPRLRNVVADSIAKSALVAANSSSFNGV